MSTQEQAFFGSLLFMLAFLFWAIIEHRRYRNTVASLQRVYYKKGLKGLLNHPEVMEVKNGKAAVAWYVVMHQERAVNIGFKFLQSNERWITTHAFDQKRFAAPSLGVFLKAHLGASNGIDHTREYEVVICKIRTNRILPWEHPWVLIAA